jgi:hypothetical protein
MKNADLQTLSTFFLSIFCNFFLRIISFILACKVSFFLRLRIKIMKDNG